MKTIQIISFLFALLLLTASSMLLNGYFAYIHNPTYFGTETHPRTLHLLLGASGYIGVIALFIRMGIDCRSMLIGLASGVLCATPALI